MVQLVIAAITIEPLSRILVHVDSKTIVNRLRVARLRSTLGVISSIRRGMATLPVPTLHLPLGVAAGTRTLQGRQMFFKARRSIAQLDAILRTLRSSDTRLDRGKIERQSRRIFCLGCVRRVEESLLLVIRLDQGNLLLTAAGEFQISQSLRIDGKDAARRSIFRRHIADGGAIGQR